MIRNLEVKNTLILPSIGVYNILIRDNKIFTLVKSPNNIYNIKTMLDDQIFIAQYLIEESDELFDFPNESTLIDAMRNRLCLDKWKVKLCKPQLEATIDAIEDALKNKYYVGCCSKYGKRYIKYDSAGTLKLYNEDGLLISTLTQGVIETNCYTNFVYTSREPEFWKWFLGV